MNWIAIGAIAEAVGVVAIFVSLVYLAQQIRQNTEQLSQQINASKLSAFERNIESGNRMRELLLLHPDIARLYLQGATDYPSLSDEQRFRFGMLLRNLFSSLQGAYVRHLSTGHDPGEFAGSVRIIDELVVRPGVREFLARNDLDWRPEFRQLVDERLREVAVPGDAGSEPA